jgi:hypothetical protein
MHEYRGKLAIGSTLGPFLSIFCTSRYYNPTPPFAYYKKGREGPSTEEAIRKTTPSNGNVLRHTQNTRTHPLTETWEPSLSRPACIPLLQAPQCKATQAAVSTRRRNVRLNQYTSCVRPAHHRRLRCTTLFTCPVSRHPPVLEHR